jgi:hypothetical protein
VHGVEVANYRILRAKAPAAPNAIAAILPALRDATGVQPHGYFAWAEGSPTRFAQWSRDRVWARLHRVILDGLGARGELDWSWCAIDSASVRAAKGGR